LDAISHHDLIYEKGVQIVCTLEDFFHHMGVASRPI
jgi:hypothetical protein